MEVKVDIGNALKKTAALKATPKALNHVVNQWAADTVMMLKRRAAGMQKAGRGRKTGHMQRNIGMTKASGEGKQRVIAIGTGVGNTKEVKYASVQDKGGTIRPKGHPFLTIPLPGVTGKARDYPDSFLCTTANGQWMIAMAKGKTGIRPLFLLRRSVTIPASNWFTGITDARERDLEEMLTPEYLLKTAAGIAGVGSIT